MRLNGLDFPLEIEGNGPPLLLLHGFTGSIRAWDEIRPALVATARVIALDLIGHGQSATPEDAARYSLEWSVRDISALLDALGLERVDVLGYSMGGRVALHFAVGCPDRVGTLVLESASPGIEDATERARRAASDDALADRLMRDGIAAFVDKWEQQPLLALANHVSSAVRERQHALRLSSQPLGLANSLRGMGAGQQMPLWSRLPELSLPVHLIVGQADTRYCAIARRMATLLPNAHPRVVADAGHTVHLDQPDQFVSHVRAALAQSRPS